MQNLRINNSILKEYRKALYLRREDFGIERFLQEKVESSIVCAELIKKFSKKAKSPSIELVLNTNSNLSKYLPPIKNRRIAVEEEYLRSLQGTSKFPFICENNVILLSDLTPLISEFVLERKQMDPSITIIIVNGGKVKDPYFQEKIRENYSFAKLLMLENKEDDYAYTNVSIGKGKQLYLSHITPVVKPKKKTIYIN